jgi:GTP-binding protein
MDIKDARFIKSSVLLEQCPPADKPEFAFIGRSNVGKSSLINMLTLKKELAKTSAKPGKTQHINHFEIDGRWYLVDLPGYGWSKVSKEKKTAWGKMIEDYLLKRENLACLFVLIDSRLEPQTIDYEFLTWLGENAIPFVLAFTKTDKISRNKVASNMATHLKKLKIEWEDLPTIIETSAINLTGRDRLLGFIGNTLSQIRS